MSAQESCLSLIKYFLFVFNLFFFVLGGLIFCFGTWILIDKTSFVSFVGEGGWAVGEGLAGLDLNPEPHPKASPGISLAPRRPTIVTIYPDRAQVLAPPLVTATRPLVHCVFAGK